MLDSRTLDFFRASTADFRVRIAYNAFGTTLSIHAQGLMSDQSTLASSMPEYAAALADISFNSPNAANLAFYLG